MAQTELEPSFDQAPTSHAATADIPSAQWGWSGESPKSMRIAALVIAAFLLFMIHGNHTGKVEDLWLVGFAVALVVIVVRKSFLNRRPR